ncbi:HAD family hydrolase [Rudaeicoccus suwonensis]|uniref:HAD superfamily hydrolase (TIGR01509 family) n=1 Tax=Rudaeicoccus suwonensis TaxID=657409 RepID=A0A561EAX2_9MICO|nr:HAD family phosphatase [Rudaeicoccus suwonensis]TWE12758.1 HAD superfamily hydrolase (TIGR01509 family) [Rudaeicoccus suwonensis]
MPSAISSRTLPAAILWDMDGTIVDSEPLWIAAEHELVESYGGRWSQELALQCVGNPLLESARIIRDNSLVTLTPEQIVDYLLERVIAGMRQELPWRPGARELLEAGVARGIPNALVTMSYRSFADVLVDAVPAGTFAVLVTGDRVANGKPHPEAYLTAAVELGVTPEHCVAIEDSLPGVTSATAAGIPTIAVPHVVSLPPIDGATQVDSLSSLDITTLWSVATGN